MRSMKSFLYDVKMTPHRNQSSQSVHSHQSIESVVQPPLRWLLGLDVTTTRKRYHTTKQTKKTSKDGKSPLPPPGHGRSCSTLSLPIQYGGRAAAQLQAAATRRNCPPPVKIKSFLAVCVVVFHPSRLVPQSSSVPLPMAAEWIISSLEYGS